MIDRLPGLKSRGGETLLYSSHADPDEPAKTGAFHREKRNVTLDEVIGS